MAIVKRLVALGLLGAGLGVPAACGGSGSGGTIGGGSGGGTSSPATCQEVCATVTALHCPNAKSEAECVTGCEDEMTVQQQAGCASQYASLLGCMKNGMTCDANGMDVGSFMSACPEDVAAMGGCSACAPDTNDDACDQCNKTSCCTEMRAAYSDPTAVSFLDCVEACNSDATCITNCSNQYPLLTAKYQALSQCQSSKCASACNTKQP